MITAPDSDSMIGMVVANDTVGEFFSVRGHRLEFPPKKGNLWIRQQYQKWRKKQRSAVKPYKHYVSKLASMTFTEKRLFVSACFLCING